ncbi:DUF6191 domain-containing protein [Streptomyces sp. NPDC050504]|uniref:DUF6191 domain-containing protein n=1 Tax=Streptomyces sp. NPDC050504 TaxID=3365618 RepID=UPI0037A6C57C
MIDALFAPGRKHTDDEAKRQELTRVDLGDGDPGRGPIDLSSGRVVIRLPDPAPEDGSKGPQTDPEARAASEADGSAES